MRLLSFALACLVLSTASAQTPARPDFKRFSGVKKWKFTYWYTGSNPYQWTEGGVTHHRSRWEEVEGGTIELDTQSDWGAGMQLTGKGKVFASGDFFKTVSMPGEIETRYDRGVGTPESRVDINLDLEAGTYDLGIVSGYFNQQYGGSTTNAWGTRTYGPETEETHNVIPVPAPAYKVPRLPESGDFIADSYSFEEETRGRAQDVSGFDLHEYNKGNPTRGTIHWTLSPADPVEVELVVESDKYADWIPEGGANEAAPGTSLPFRAYLVSKDGGALKRHAVSFVFELIESSKEKGIALNFPLTGAQALDDLAFSPAYNFEGQILSQGRAIKFPGNPADSVAATVTAFDWGAYGALRVTAQLDNGKTIVGRFKGDAGNGPILLPKRSPESKIADAWKKLAGFSGPDGEDEDLQEGNPHPGDGLTAYEEYRGLVIKGVHTRRSKLLDTRRKNLVVENRAGAAVVPGLKWFERASGISVIEAAPGELPASREVNLNRGAASGGAQFGLVLKIAKLGGNVAGENRPKAVLNKTPRLSDEVILDLDFAKTSYAEQAAAAATAGVTIPYSLAEDIQNTIAHEIAHGLGAPHHGKETEYFGPSEVTERMVDWHAYGVDGVEIKKPFKLPGRIGRPGNDASGDAGCIMAYTNFYNWAAVGRAGGPYKFYAVGLQPLGRGFCRSAAGTGMNAPHTVGAGVPVPSFFGDALGQGSGSPVGDCLGAMKVRDW